jgi:hypothetical protein
VPRVLLLEPVKANLVDKCAAQHLSTSRDISP